MTEPEFDIIEDYSYKITPNGSEYYHCTPKILGDSFARILSLDFSKMRIESADIVYDLISYDGVSVPNIVLNIVTPGRKGDIHFSIKCVLWFLPPDLSTSTEVKPLPDLNALTPFTYSYGSIELEFYFHSCQFRGRTRFLQDSSIVLKSYRSFGEKESSFKIECFDLSINFDD